MVGTQTWKRFSLLKRAPHHSPESFRSYYREIHGPLAANQAGFRKYTREYVQNHVETRDWPASVDAISVTTQFPRADYGIGFFDEPDYAVVRADEEKLFDLGHTVSVLGVENVLRDGAASGSKVMVLLRPGEDRGRWLDDLAAHGAVQRLVLNRLDAARATALGFGGAALAAGFAVEAWFASSQSRAEALPRLDEAAGAANVLPVREVRIFGPDNPWPVDASAR